MFYVNGNPIMAEEMDVLNELKSQLAMNGIQMFRSLKRSGNNIQFNCPVHAGGQEAKPSCGISTSNKKTDDGTVIPAGTVHCFACGYTASLEQMISYCFGKDDDGYFGKEWLTKNFLTIAVDARKPLELDMSRGGTGASKQKFISEEELEKYRWYHDYMYARKLTNEVIDLFDVGYDWAFILADGRKPIACITFPVKDERGRCLFIARRAISSKLFHYPEGVDKPVYGLYELEQAAPDVKEVIVCESIINALTCWAYGRPAVALNGTGTQKQYNQLARLKCRKLIAGFDPDDAGRKATKRLRDHLSGSKIITEFDLPDGKDINDLTKEEFFRLRELF